MSYGGEYIPEYALAGEPYFDPAAGAYHDPNAAPRMVDPKKTENGCWKSWGGFGAILGLSLIIFGGTMLPIEISRIITGSLNRSRKGSYLLYPNYNILRNGGTNQIQKFMPDLLGPFLPGEVAQPDLDEKGIIPYDALSTQGFNNFPIQDKYLWPWSHAALLFALVTVAAGIVGMVSGCRRTYGSLFSFFSLALLSWMLSIFLIVYYAVHIHWSVTKNVANRNASYWVDLDFRLAAVMLALSCAVFIFSMLSACCSGCAFSIGRNKARLVHNGPPRRQRKQKNAQPMY